MQLCMRKVETKAVMTVRMKFPIFSALGILKIFIFVINLNFINLVIFIGWRTENPYIEDGFVSICLR